MTAKSTDDSIKETILRALAKKEHTRTDFYKLFSAKVNAAKLTEMLTALAEEKKISERRLTYADTGRHLTKTKVWGLWESPQQAEDRARQQKDEDWRNDFWGRISERGARREAKESWIKYAEEFMYVNEPGEWDKILRILSARLEARPKFHIPSRQHFHSRTFL